MTTANFNLRGLDANVMNRLKQEADKQSISVNILIIKFIEQGIGYSHTVPRPAFHDLDHLAGTWSEQDAKTFKANTSHFEKVDKDLWK